MAGDIDGGVNVCRDQRAVCRWQARIDTKTYRVKEVRFARVVFADDASRAVRDRHVEVLEERKFLMTTRLRRIRFLP